MALGSGYKVVDFVCINPYPAKLIYLNFQPPEVVCRYRDPQIQVAKTYSYLFHFSTNIGKSWCLDTHSFPITVIWSTNKTDLKRQ